MYKNVAGQKIAIVAYNQNTGARVTGDAANLTAKISKDGGAGNALATTAATEVDAPDNPGVYTFSISQTESNADLVVLSVVSATANVVIDEVVIYTRNHDGLVDAILDEAMSGHTTAGTLGGALQSVYWADINFTVTDDETKDRYSARWFKDGTRLTSGITSPTTS